MGDELGDVVDLNLQSSPGIPEIVQTGGTFGEQNLCPCVFNDLSQPILRNGDGILRGDATKPSSGAAAHGIFP